MGLFVSFSRSVIAKAAAVATSRPTRTPVERIRCKAASVYARERSQSGRVTHADGPPRGDDERHERTGGDEPAVPVRRDELRSRREQHRGEPERPVADAHRPLAAEQDAGNGADEKPGEGVRVDVAGDEVPKAGHPQQTG